MPLDGLKALLTLIIPDHWLILSQEFKNQLTYGGQLSDESVDVM